ncbi:hypothetical protein [Sporosarcina psychrophila]|uniref:Uncharacterized protein n=1 Tax=Sporosarcina psychrophila TaxID=1476 RepID=A0ABV2KCH7_SPOPS
MNYEKLSDAELVDKWYFNSVEMKSIEKYWEKRHGLKFPNKKEAESNA